MIRFLFIIILLTFVSFILDYWVISFICFFVVFKFIFLNVRFNFSLISIEFGIDYWSYYFVILSLWICILIIISSGLLYEGKYWWGIFIFVVLLIIILLIIVFISLNFFFFYLFFEARLIPTLILIIGWGYQPERLQAGLYILLYTLFVSLPIIISIFYLYYRVGSIVFGFIRMEFSLYIYLCIRLVFFIKFPIFLVHLWLPKAHVESPVSGSIVLAGVILKLGGYGLVRLLGIRGRVINYRLYFLSLGLVGGVYISLICLRQFDIKSLVAYSSVAHIGLVISGILIMNLSGIIGSLILILAHGLCSSGLFCLTNIVYERTSRRSLFINKGIINIIPFLSLWWFIFCVFNIAAPPSLNLLGELFLFISVIGFEIILLFLISLISFFGACYSLYLYSFGQHGKMMVRVFIIWSNNIREHVLILLHFFPLVLYILSSYIYLSSL